MHHLRNLYECRNKNLLTLTEYSGYDPEISNGGVLNTGIDIGTYPQPRTWSMGLNIKF